MPTSILDVIRAIQDDLRVERQKLREAEEAANVHRARIKKADKLLRDLSAVAGVPPPLRVSPELARVPVPTHSKPLGIAVLDEKGEQIEDATARAPPGSHKCPECGRVFSRPNILGIHRRFVHGVEGTSRRAIETRQARQNTARVVKP